MGNKRRGLNNIEKLTERLKRELQLNQSTLVGQKRNVKSLAAGSNTLTAADSGSIVLFAAAAATTVTLPSAQEGLHFTFVHSIQGTGNHIINCSTDTQGFLGGVVINCQTANKDDAFPAASDGSDDRITMDGTTGNAPGTRIELVGISSTRWAVTGVITSDDSSAATPFSDNS